MRITTRMRRPARSPARAALLAAAAVGGTAAALPAVSAANMPYGPSDPLDTNVPYLAWRGEQVKLAACASRERSADLTAQAVPIGSLNVDDFLVEDWSGADPDRAKPQIETSTQRAYLDDEGRFCIAADVVSLKAGIAPVKLVVSHGGEPVFKHQFLVIWMNQDDPTLTQLPSGGDPNGTGTYDAGRHDGRVRVTVTGNVPLLGNYSELGLGDRITLPNDYPALAGRLARSDDPLTDRNPLLWDVHDDQLPTIGHPFGPCHTNDHVTIDAVDNCIGGGDTGPFSAFDALTRTAFLSSDHAIGPFDPTRARDTYLPDGQLTAGDAQMPALRVDVSITANSGGRTDTSGIGTLTEVDKSDVYSRDGHGSPFPHNLYAPFYKAFIPATAAGESSSGIDGPSQGSNFVGFLNDNPYTFWQHAFVLRRATDGRTRCLLAGDDYRHRPYGPQSVVVYTDEHGEAQVGFRPGVDAFFDALVTPDRNGACDLQGVDPLGTAEITAIGRYPYQPVTDPDHAAPQRLVQTVHSLFDKSLFYEPKGTTEATSNVRLLTAHAQDVDGRPFVGETVCFSHDSNAEGIIVFGDFSVVRDPLGGNRLCTRTDWRGNAVVEVLNSNRTVTDVIAQFVDERLFRDIHVDFGTPNSRGGTPPPRTSVPGGEESGGGDGHPHFPPHGGPGTTAPTAGQLAAAGLPPNMTGLKGKKPKNRIASSFLTRRPHGKAWVTLRITGSGRCKVKIKVLARNGRALGQIARTVPTNRKVRIGLGKLSKQARTVRVSLG
jgi:hypothetical protein